MNKRLIWNFEINSESSLTIPETCNEDEQTERWESRFFWPEREIIVLNGLDASFLALSRYQAKHREDVYCLLPDTDYNLKIRRNQLMYKPIMMKTRHAVAYGKKINLEELQPTTSLPGAGDADASALLIQVQREGQRIHVEKEALVYRFETVPTLKLELARLYVADTTWFSVNIESRSRRLVDSLRQQMFDGQASCDYVTFLKGL